MHSKKDYIYLQLFKINDNKTNSLPFFAISDIKTIKVENLHSYFAINNVSTKDVLFFGHQSNIVNKLIDYLNVSRDPIQHPDSLGIGKLASSLISSRVNLNKTTLVFNKFKPIYVRPAQINLK